MEPIRQLLNRIHWDRDFGAGHFEIGIYDRIEDRVEYIPLESIKTEPGNRFSFTMMRNGEMLSIPFHRIRAVKKNSEIIWRR
jgi:uncharacterized protein (UPF0248 family)